MKFEKKNPLFCREKMNPLIYNVLKLYQYSQLAIRLNIFSVWPIIRKLI